VTTKTLKLKDVPKSVDFEIGRALLDYSAAVCRVRGNNPNTFAPIGSGTFVIRNGVHGILTAHHCLHTCSPEIRIGSHGEDTLLLVVTRGRCVILDPRDVKEHPLGIPKLDSIGPDLTFVEIFPGAKLDLLKAIVSFWNLDPKNQDLANKLSVAGILIVESGFPEVDYRTSIIGSDIHHDLKHVVFIGALGDQDISQQDKWDYINSKCNYRGSEKLPETFKGVSGGGIWAVRLQATNGQKWAVGAYCLVGVAFYETELVDDRRELRGHFVKTIYHTAWNQKAEETKEVK
jgi:hypothetical protein